MEPKKERGRPTKEPKRNAMGRIIEEPVELPPEPPYTITLRLGDDRYESTGVTMLEALTNLATPNKIFVKGFVEVTNGERKTERCFLPRDMHRFLYPIARVVMAKRLQLTLK